MAQIQVDSEHVLAANSTIQATIAKLQAEVDGLHVQLIGLQDVWRGSAASSFQELVTRWKVTATTVDAKATFRKFNPVANTSLANERITPPNKITNNKTKKKLFIINLQYKI